MEWHGGAVRNGEIEEPLEDMPFPIGFMGLGFTTWWFFTNPFEKICEPRQIGFHESPRIGVNIEKYLKPPPI